MSDVTSDDIGDLIAGTLVVVPSWIYFSKKTAIIITIIVVLILGYLSVSRHLNK